MANTRYSDANDFGARPVVPIKNGGGTPQVELVNSAGTGNTVIDNAAFTDGTTPVTPAGFIFDDVAGTALTENDAAAARISSRRAQLVEGVEAGAATAAANPVNVGAVNRTTLPTYTDGQRTELQAGTRGALNVQLMAANATNAATVTNWANDGQTVASVNGLAVLAQMEGYNGTSEDRWRANVDGTVFASAARTGTPTPFDGVNYNGRGLHLVIDCTSITSSPSVVFTIQGKDALSGKFYTILASAAIVGTGTTVLKVFPGITAAANASVSDILPRSWRVIATHGNSDSITYTVGSSVVV